MYLQAAIVYPTPQFTPRLIPCPGGRGSRRPLPPSYPKLGAHLNYYLHTHFVVPDRYRRLFGRTNVG